LEGRSRVSKVFSTIGAAILAIYVWEYKGKLVKLNCMDIKLLLDRRIAKNKKGSLTDREIQLLVKDWHDRCSEGDLQQETIEMETKSMEKKLRKYSMEQLGEIPLEQEDETM
jgi:hypothetical protein